MLKRLLFIAVSCFIMTGCLSNNIVSDSNIKTAASQWFGTSDMDKISINRLDFTCDGVEDVIASKAYTDHPNGEIIIAAFITRENNKLENIPQFVHYNAKDKTSLNVCGSPENPYTISTTKVNLSALEKSITDRDYCDTGIIIEAGGCKSEPIYSFMSTGPRGRHLSLVR